MVRRSAYSYFRCLSEMLNQIQRSVEEITKWAKWSPVDGQKNFQKTEGEGPGLLCGAS